MRLFFFGLFFHRGRQGFCPRRGFSVIFVKHVFRLFADNRFIQQLHITDADVQPANGSFHIFALQITGKAGIAFFKVNAFIAHARLHFRFHAAQHLRPAAADNHRLQIGGRCGINVPHRRFVRAQKQNDAFARLVDPHFGVKSPPVFAQRRISAFFFRLIGAVGVNLAFGTDIFQPAQRRFGQFRFFMVTAIGKPTDGIVQNFAGAGFGAATAQPEQRVGLIGINHFRHLTAALVKQAAELQVLCPERCVGADDLGQNPFRLVAINRWRQALLFGGQHQERTRKISHPRDLAAGGRVQTDIGRQPLTGIYENKGFPVAFRQPVYVFKQNITVCQQIAGRGKKVAIIVAPPQKLVVVQIDNAGFFETLDIRFGHPTNFAFVQQALPTGVIRRQNGRRRRAGGVLGKIKIALRQGFVADNAARGIFYPAGVNFCLLQKAFRRLTPGMPAQAIFSRFQQFFAVMHHGFGTVGKTAHQLRMVAAGIYFFYIRALGSLNFPYLRVGRRQKQVDAFAGTVDQNFLDISFLLFGKQQPGADVFCVRRIIDVNFAVFRHRRQSAFLPAGKIYQPGERLRINFRHAFFRSAAAAAISDTNDKGFFFRGVVFGLLQAIFKLVHLFLQRGTRGG